MVTVMMVMPVTVESMVTVLVTALVR